MITDRNASRSSEGGFVLFEVLVAAAILALVGTVVMMIGIELIAGGQKELDRSVAETNLLAYGQELAIIGASLRDAVFPVDDGLFQYTAEALPTDPSSPIPTALELVRIEAHPRANLQQVVVASAVMIPKVGQR